ncbi:MAG: rhodanese-like domain-containing protein, partial [Crocosphaera sp.]
IPQAQAEEAQEKSAIPEISVKDLKELMDHGADAFVLIDVRNVNEYEIARIPGAVLVPLPEIEEGPGVEKVKELAKEHRLIAHCKMGGRSAKALKILQNAGVEGINVKGGITAWSQEVDPNVPQY